MKTRLFVLGLVALSIPALAFVGCSDSNNNQQDGGPINQPDTGSNPDVQNPRQDGGADGGPNVCATGVVFDNKRVPGYPNPPAP